MVVPISNLNIQKAVVVDGFLWVWGQPGLYSETLLMTADKVDDDDDSVMS